ncbi:hypothetical protein CANCADRAFT_31155 [Tortispora caseinolytica NRRL Y-17796]|uniref:HECT-type E3 ubiquitin transferase n=1 Tax=Tortispora caseinolytica NRRL Y-17796 TaxID=767744 RepID=A0A1E4TEB0_9ASCO|nr:hypothetical protein CANCADRAFT_31155 [Tortispora caseinolytica NRRL Y-17796]
MPSWRNLDILFSFNRRRPRSPYNDDSSVSDLALDCEMNQYISGLVPEDLNVSNSKSKKRSSTASDEHAAAIIASPSIGSTCPCCLSIISEPQKCLICDTVFISYKEMWELPASSPTIRLCDIVDILAMSSSTALNSIVTDLFSRHCILNEAFNTGLGIRYSSPGIDYAVLRRLYCAICSSKSSKLINKLLHSIRRLLKTISVAVDPSKLLWLMVIFECPLIWNCGYNNRIMKSIHKRLFGIMSNLSDECQIYLVNWFARLPVAEFAARIDEMNTLIIQRINSYTSGDNDIESESTDFKPATLSDYADDWQLRSFCKVLSLFFAANVQKPQVHVSHFYNLGIDQVDLRPDFNAWLKKTRGNKGKSLAGSTRDALFLKKPYSAGEDAKMLICNFPFLLSIGSKSSLIEHDANRQMRILAQNAFFSSLERHLPISGSTNIKVRRNCIIEDSLRQLSNVDADLKMGITVTFDGEEGIDAGGLRKEWFTLLTHQVFDPLNGMFVLSHGKDYYWFNSSSFESADQYYLVGEVLGLAIYNSAILNIPLAPAIYKKLLGISCTLADLSVIDPELADGLKKLLKMPKDTVEDVYCRNFTVEEEMYGEIKTVELITNGKDTPLTGNNRHLFVNAYVEYLLETRIAKQFEPFKRGFYKFLDPAVLQLFRPQEIELLVCGSAEEWDTSALQAITEYANWNCSKPLETVSVIKWLWEIVDEFESEQRKQFMSFVTGSDRLPVGGLSSLRFKVVQLADVAGYGDSERFPLAHTCFNQLGLYAYATKDKLKSKLITAISGCEGFDME